MSEQSFFIIFEICLQQGIDKIAKTMLIERKDNEVIIRLPSYVDTEGLQRLVDYLIYKEAISKSKAKQADVDKLAKEVKKGWWAKNRKRLISGDK